MVSEWQNRSLSDPYLPYVMTGVIYIKIRENHRVVSKSYHIAIGISGDGEREIIGFMIQNEESDETWYHFFDHLKTRGLSEVDMVISDAYKGLVKTIKKSFTTAYWQRCQVHFMRNILSCIPKKDSKPFREEVKVLFKFTDIETARKAKNTIISDYTEQSKYHKACEKLDEGFEDDFQYAVVSRGQSRLKSTNLLERLNEEVRRRKNYPNISESLLCQSFNRCSSY